MAVLAIVPDPLIRIEILIGVDRTSVRIVAGYAADRQMFRGVELFGLLVVACESSTGVDDIDGSTDCDNSHKPAHHGRFS